jgi:hypothetical protein
MKLEITKERVLEAASKCDTAKQTLKTLFPEIFKEEEEELWELKTRADNEIYFQNTLTKKVFQVGDDVTIKDSDFRFGDSVRNHQIKGFSFQFGEVLNKVFYKKRVYAHFEGYDFERALLLDQITHL